MYKNPLYIFIGGFIGGVGCFSLAGPNVYVTLFFIFLGGVLYLTHLLRHGQAFFLVALILFSFGLGGLRIGVIDLRGDNTVLDGYLGARVLLEGVIIEEPDERETQTRIIVRVEKIFDTEPVFETKVITGVDRFPSFHYGDRVRLDGVLARPENFSSDNGRIFDYRRYLAKDNVHYTLSFPDATFISGGHGHPVKEFLFTLKQAWLSRVEELIPDPHVSLLGGLVVGAKQSLGKNLEDDFRKTGIIHIVVLSGYNVTIVADAIMKFFSLFLPSLASLSLGALSIVLFALMTGASATIVRASIMALLVLLARATGRTSQITHALFLAAFFMVLHNPMIVLFDPSFQLSFLATVGLIYCAPALERYATFITARWKLREFAVATIATQIFVLPFLLYMMGDVSLVALPVNLLILGLIPATMLFGFLTGIIGFISATLAFPFAAVSYVLLAYELSVVDLFAQLPFASVTIEHFPLSAMIILYIMYGFFLRKLFIGKREIQNHPMY